MDQLYWDTFGYEDDVYDDVLFYQALKLIRQCPCRRFQDSASVSHCVRCKALRALFARRLEIDSFQAYARSDHLSESLVVEPALSEELGDSVLDERWDENDSESDDESRLEEVPDRPGWQDASAEQSDYSFNTADTSNAETEQLGAEPDIGSPEFNLPALQLVWERNTTNLRRAAQITLGQSYGRGTAHAVGLFANCDDPSIWLRLGYWVRRQKEIWLHTSRIG
ncbi:hypothetical protein QBC47DRAFT_375281 [Echria macrotheca]|uniref:Uncharacterized protein n=1 Tax=Echria macrotheca TaxID=438768 RepID=A0AAJ0FCR5_9PEZI|nr:hypothetical protein QBC47DRAFT_375281 [Echria macrotheca]